MAKDKKAKLLEELVKNPAGADARADEFRKFGLDPAQTVPAVKTAKEILDDPDGPDRSGQFAKLPYAVKLALLDELAAEGAANFLARLQRDEKDKAVGKAIAKAIHECRAQGLKVTDMREKKSVQFDFSSEGVPDSYVSALDTDGNRLVLLARVTPLGKLNVFHSVVGDTQGLGNFEGMGMTRASYRRFLQMAEAQMGVPMAKVPGDYAAWLVAEGARTATAAGLPLPAQFEQARGLIEPPVSEPKHPLHSLLDEAEVVKTADLSKSADLHRLAECAFWMPEESALEKLTERMKKADDSKVAVHEGQKQDIRMREARDAAKEYWTADRRKVWSGRLRETAYVLAATGRPEEAKLAWATAIELAKGADVEKLPFATELFEKIVAAGGVIDPHAGHDHGPGEHGKPRVTAEMRDAAKAEDESASLIVKP